MLGGSRAEGRGGVPTVRALQQALCLSCRGLREVAAAGPGSSLCRRLAQTWLGQGGWNGPSLGPHGFPQGDRTRGGVCLSVCLAVQEGCGSPPCWSWLFPKPPFCNPASDSLHVAAFPEQPSCRLQSGPSRPRLPFGEAALLRVPLSQLPCAAALRREVLLEGSYQGLSQGPQPS